jgi:hypothetical protein
MREGFEGGHLHIQLVRFRLRRTIYVWGVKQVLNTDKHLFNCDGRPPVFFFVQDTVSSMELLSLKEKKRAACVFVATSNILFPTDKCLGGRAVERIYTSEAVHIAHNVRKQNETSIMKTQSFDKPCSPCLGTPL